MSKKHPGFKAVQAEIAAKEGISKDRAGAILASSARKAGPAAKEKNPRLNRVKGKAEGKKEKPDADEKKKKKSQGKGYDHSWYKS